ncbi:MAG: GspE/PulE family protein [Proteobacteria bacterium]|nr:GspE/PulE family protein [Pseudomonadota bacterium]HQR03989.1 GspE/PulE family protein [Rhodocyclaceae bacterium]
MNAVMNPGADGNLNDVSSRLNFFKSLQTVTNKIHATSNVDEIMLELSQDICSLFNADRLTIYSVGDDKASIISKVKTGLNSFKDLRLPITDQSVAGYVALSKRIINVCDVYDDAELKAVNPSLRFLQEVDKRTGYRTKQMLVAPILDQQNSELLGVVQIINNKAGTPFVTVAEEGVKGLCETLAIAFTQRNKAPHQVRSKYDYLVADAIVTAEELDLAKRTSRKDNRSIESVLIEQYQVSLPILGASLSKFFNVPYEGYVHDRMKPVDLLKNLKREYLEQNHWVPIDDVAEGIVVMCLDPEQVRGSRVVNNVFGRNKVVYRVTTNREFHQTLDGFFGSSSTSEGDLVSVDDMLLSMADDSEEAGDVADDVSAAADNELVKLVNKIIIDAYQMGASDIHVEPGMGKDKTLIRLRRDGSLQKYIEIPASFRNAIVARLKIMCDLDISERRKPQDGKIKFKKFGPLDIELRVATIPSTGGVEDVVMRILAAGEPIPLDKLGVLPSNLATLKATVSKPYGLFFVCGPTGSGKTTTLHSVLGYLNTPDTKIWTAEDPVEITQKGLRQVQVNKKVMDFATVMKAFLRADPDIIMVGEMRDAETTGIGIEASLTGHLVFATLHTNSAPESIIRLLDMGMDPFNFADALLGILAQRLAKRLCKCKEEYVPDEAEIKQFMTEYCSELVNTETFKKDGPKAQAAVYKRLVQDYGKDGRLVFCRAKGCDACGGSGYKGRVGLHELMVGTEPIKKLIQEHARVAQLFAQALEDGMLTLKMDGMEKILQGITDLKQVRAVCIK